MITSLTTKLLYNLRICECVKCAKSAEALVELQMKEKHISLSMYMQNGEFPLIYFNFCFFCFAFLFVALVAFLLFAVACELFASKNFR